MTDETGMEIIKILLKQYPGLLNNEMDANAKASVVVSSILGCLLAGVLKKYGEEYYRKSLRAVLDQVDKNARTVKTMADNVTPTRVQ